MKYLLILPFLSSCATFSAYRTYRCEVYYFDRYGETVNEIALSEDEAVDMVIRTRNLVSSNYMPIGPSQVLCQ